MSNDYFNPPNSVWPNGLKRDGEGYVTFYPLGTNKVDISTITWPEGDKLISPFVFKNDKLVGFVDTKALTVSGTATTTMNYNHIEANFASIFEGDLTINAPNAAVTKFRWAVSVNPEDITFVIIDFSNADEETINTVRTAQKVIDNKLYDANNNLIGTLDTSKIEVGGIYDEENMTVDGLFSNSDRDGNIRSLTLSEFSSDLSSLNDGANMFYKCYSLTSFSSDLSNLTEGNSMFNNCAGLTSFTSNLSSLTDGSYMFHLCSLDAPSVKNIALTINKNTSNARFDIGVDNSIANDEQVKKDLGLIKHKGWNLWINGSNLPMDYTLPKYAGCTNVDEIKAKDANYLTNDIVNGVWSEHLPDLEAGNRMFEDCTSLTSFSGDLSSLTNGSYMFTGTALTSFSSDLSNLTNGDNMFYNCTKLTTFDSDLSSLTYGDNMFYNCTKLTTFDSDLSSLTYGYSMFYGTSLTSFSGDLSNLTNGKLMFYNCTSLTSFSIDLSSLTNGSSMFEDCTKLTSFSGDLSKLTNGRYMFKNCTKLTSFNGGDLSKLTDGYYMFHGCTNLTSFSVDLSSLTNGYDMFSNCDRLTSFNSNLGSLTNGFFMFDGTALTSFNSNLGSLTNGYDMFRNCKLNTESIKSIADTIKDVTELTNSSYGSVNKQIDLGINNSTPTTEEQGYLNTIASRGWKVYVNGSTYKPTGVASVMTLDEDGNEVETPIPYYAKPIASDEEHAEYIDADGNYFNIVGAQFIYGDDLSTYGMFTCEDDAAVNMRLMKIEKP